MPMVSMTIVNCGWPRIGRITRRSSSSPNSPIATAALITPIQNGMPRAVTAPRPTNDPSIIRSP